MKMQASHALFSPDRRYRYTLFRKFSGLHTFLTPVICFIGLNPSTADETVNDPTIKKCMKFCQRWGAESLLMLNVYAYRATKPEDMFAQYALGVDIVGEENTTAHLIQRLNTYSCLKVVCAWGRNADVYGRVVADNLRAWSRETGADLCCFSLNSDGSPVHPLYQPDAQNLIKF